MRLHEFAAFGTTNMLSCVSFCRQGQEEGKSGTEQDRDDGSESSDDGEGSTLSTLIL